MTYNGAPIISEMNHCDSCSTEIVGRKAVEALVNGVERVFVSSQFLRKRVYPSGASYLMGNFDGMRKTGYPRMLMPGDDRYRERYIRCGCDGPSREVKPHHMLRPEYQSLFLEKFGTSLSLPMLFTLPVHMVAWENSGVVCVDLDSGYMQLAEQGENLLDIIRDMSRAGVFTAATNRLSEFEVVQGFSYLHMVKPEYRTFVAHDFGASVSLGTLMSRVPTEWLAWDTFLSLTAVEMAGGTLEVRRAVGVPLAACLLDFFSRDKAENNAKGMKPVVKGSHIARNGVWVQMMPAADKLGHDELVAAHVLLEAGGTFLPSGRIVMKGTRMAVTFDPGVSVTTAGGSVISPGEVSTTLFVSGEVDVVLHLAGCAAEDQTCSCLSTTTAPLEYRVGAYCESYDDRTLLSRWYSNRFKVSSYDGQFVAENAEFLVFNDGDGTLQSDTSWVGGDNPVIGCDGRNVCRMAYDVPVGRKVPWVTYIPEVVMRAEHSTGGRVDIGPVHLAMGSSIAFLGKHCVGVPMLTGCEGYEMVDEVMDGVLSFTSRTNVHYGDEGEDSELEDWDSTTTTVSDELYNPLSALVALRDGALLVNSDRCTFTSMSDDPVTLIAAVGANPSVDDLLRAPKHLFNSERVARIGMMISRHQGPSFVVRKHQNFSWKSLLDYARTWRKRSFLGDDFHELLLELHSEMRTGVTITKYDICV